MATKNDKVKKDLSKLIKDAYLQKSSDIHLEYFENDEAKIRFRIDGVLQLIKKVNHDTCNTYCEMIKSMSKLDMKEKRLPQYGRIVLEVDGKTIDLRVATYPCINGENITLRLLDRAAIQLDLQKVAPDEIQLKTFQRWASQPNGIVLVTGPTGSGKTTVLYALLNELNRDSIKICSIEDPVEYTINGVNQLPINPKIGVTFSTAIRATLRQDPDVIMVGEIRDYETSLVIIKAALTGHLVLSTLHTYTATDAVIRLRDIGVEPFLIKDTLSGISSQRLVRILCKECREEYQPDTFTLDYLELPKQNFYKAVGCKKCNNTGYRGRTAIYELFDWSNSCKNLLLKNCNREELRRQAISEGMVTLFQDGIKKARQGITSLEEVIRVTGGNH